MPISINISGENASEVKQLVSDLASVVFGVSDQSFPQTTVVSTLEETATAAEPTTVPEKEAPKQETKSTAEGEEITKEDLRALAQEKSKSVGSAAVRDVLSKYGGIPKAKPEDHAKIKEELESL